MFVIIVCIFSLIFLNMKYIFYLLIVKFESVKVVYKLDNEFFNVRLDVLLVN